MKKTANFIYILLIGYLLLNDISPSYSIQPLLSDKEMKIKLTFNNHQAIAILVETPTTQNLLKQLPITITFDNYADTEKIAYLPNKLSITSPKGHSPKTGDIAYYIPWGNLAFYYKDGTASNDLIYIGKIISGLEALASQDTNVKFTIERVE